MSNDTRINLIRGEDLESWPVARIFCGRVPTQLIHIHESNQTEGEVRQLFCCGQSISESIAGAACINQNQGFRWLLLVGRIADRVTVSE
jgi:hypothetical protein